MYLLWNSYNHVLNISRMHVPMYISVCRTSPRVSAFLLRSGSRKKMLLWKFGFAIIVSTSYLPVQCITNRTFSMVLPKIALFINLNKLFLNSFFAKVLKFVRCTREAMEIARIAIYMMDLCNAETVTNTLLQIAIIYDVTFFIIQYRKKLLLSLAGWFLACWTKR